MSCPGYCRLREFKVSCPWLRQEAQRIQSDPQAVWTCSLERIGPARHLPRRGRLDSAREPVSRILFYAVIPLGAALPQTLVSDLPGGFGACMEQPCGAGPAPGASLAPGSRFPPYLVLLRVGFTLPQPLLSARCALTAPFHPYPCGGQAFGQVQSVPGGPPEGGVAEAVSFLWH